MPEDEKDMLKLCIEATNVNKKFIDLSTTGTEEIGYNEASEHFKDVIPGKAFRYRRWILENKIHIACRSEVDAYIPVKEGEGERKAFTKVCALYEYDAGGDWTSNYETNRGAMIS